MHVGVDVVAEESHRAVSQKDLSAAGMPATRPKEAREVNNDIGDATVRRVVAIGHRADRSRVRP